ncbi:23252_t:CDS:2, partial [Gigaspora rosea]
ITAIVKSENNDPIKILFLKIKAFVPIDKDVEHYIDPFEIGDITAISIKVTNLEFDDMPMIGVEPADFWVEVRHKVNNTYLANRTNSINQKIHSTTALLVRTINYLHPISDSNKEKHVLTLEEISLLSIYVNNKNTNNQGINISWLSQGSSSARTLNRINCTPRGAMPRTPQKDCTTLFQMGLTILQTALNANLIPLSTEQILLQDQNNQTDHEFN